MKTDKSMHSKLAELAEPGALETRLELLDTVRPVNRIYVMGCGRSGTWLLTSIFSTYKDIALYPDEVPVELFGLLQSNLPVLVLKRHCTSYQHIEQIPGSIKIAWIVRHPFDVLTSYNPTTDRQYHIKPYRWLGEMLALQYLVDTNRPNTRIYRYEDLVSDPDSIQNDLAQEFDLEVESSVDQLQSTFKPSSKAEKAMHGFRKIDMKSVNKFRKDPQKIEYLKKIQPRLGRLLDWVATEYSYDVRL
jgi:hypothetical protein